MQNRDKKRLAKEKKRKEAHRQARAAFAAMPSSSTGLVRLAATCPFGPCFVSSSYRELDHALVSLVTILVSHRLPTGLLLPASVLVDRTCLGLKDGAVLRPMGMMEFVSVTERYASTAHPMEPCDLLLAQSIVFHALDYSHSLGFSPHPDVVLSLFGPRPTTLLDTPFARPEKPIYVSGPHDDVPWILDRLNRSVGNGNYEFTFSAGQLDGEE